MSTKLTLSKLFDSQCNFYAPNDVFDKNVFDDELEELKIQASAEAAKSNIHLVSDQGKFFIKYDDKEDYSLPLLELNVPELSETLLNSSIAVFGGSKSGKTVFTSYLIYCLLYKFRALKIGLVIVARTLNAFEKLKNITTLLSEKMKYKLNLDDDVLCISDPKLLEQLYQTIYANVADERGLGDKISANKDAPPLPDQAKDVLNKFANFIFYFDDCTDIYCDTAFKPFFNKFPTTHRHARITAIYNTHSFQFMNQNLRQNINNFAIAGLASDRVVKLIHDSIHLVGVVFQKPARLSKLLFNKEKFFNNDKTILVIREQTKSLPLRAVYHYCMDNEFVEKLIALETTIKPTTQKQKKASPQNKKSKNVH